MGRFGDTTARSLRDFFLTLSSPSFLRLSRLATPFSSGGAVSAPGTGPELASCFIRLGRGLLNVCNPSPEGQYLRKENENAKKKNSLLTIV